jgi:hypothetical protein
LLESGTGRTYPDNPCPTAIGYVDHYAGAIRNNFIAAASDALFASQSGFDCGICLAQACGASLLHNSVASTQAPFSSIEWRFANTQAEIYNNLVSHNLRARDGAAATLGGNLENAPSDYFSDIPIGDLHLTAQASLAIDQGVPLAAGRCDEDIDGEPRPPGSGRDIGADEIGVPPLDAVTDLHISTTLTSSVTLTVTLGWSAPGDAEGITIRYHDSPIDESSWDGATLLAGDLPGDKQSYTAALSLPGGITYFALKWQDLGGAWSPVSNNAFWPAREIYLPLVGNQRQPLSP